MQSISTTDQHVRSVKFEDHRLKRFQSYHGPTYEREHKLHSKNLSIFFVKIVTKLVRL